jgi:hypothetical protein
MMKRSWTRTAKMSGRTEVERKKRRGRADEMHSSRPCPSTLDDAPADDALFETIELGGLVALIKTNKASRPIVRGKCGFW